MKVELFFIFFQVLFVAVHTEKILDNITLSLSTSVFEDCGVRFEDNGVCACNKSIKSGTVTCYNATTVKLEVLYCIYYEEALNRSIVSQCVFPHIDKGRLFFHINTTSVSNDKMCNSEYGNYNREGRFCGQCKEGYGLAVYSYHYIDCIPCKDYGYMSWIKYFTVALLPLTVFYIFAILLKFNVTSSRFNGTLMIVQCVTSPIHLRLIDVIFKNKQYRQQVMVVKLARILTTICGIDNSA